MSPGITEVLVALQPKDDEKELFKKFANDNGDYESLTEEDIVLVKLGRIPRLSEKIEVLQFMACLQVRIGLAIS